MKKLFFILLATVLLLSGCRQETTVELPPPPSSDWHLPSGITYGELEQTIDSLVEKHQDTMAGLAISVFTRDHVLLEKYYGYANIEEGLAVDADTVFEWASITKTMVWVSAMQLYEQGKLDLNADIRTYLPEDFFAKKLYDEPITMLHLMNHTAGWTSNTLGRSLFVEYGQKVYDLEQELRLADPIQNLPPGMNQDYSNYGVALAGYVVECISGIPFYEYVHSNIFEPLGMNHTALKPDLSDNEWVSIQRDKLKCYAFYDSMLDMGSQRYQNPIYPAGMSTGVVADMRRYGQALLPDANGVSPLFAKAATMAEMYTSTYPAESYDENCHGFWKYPFENTVIGHFGGSLGCSSCLLIDIDGGIGIAVMTNTSNPSITGDMIMEIISGEMEQPQEYYDASAELMESGIKITWTPEDETTGYWIWRTIYNGQIGWQLNDNPTMGGEYIDETADPDTTYYYTIVKTGSDPSKGVKAKYQK